MEPDKNNNRGEAKNISGGTNITEVKYKKPALVGLLIIVSISAGFFGGQLGVNNKNRTNSLDKTSKTSQQIVLSESQLISEIAKNVGPSVVSVNVTRSSTQNDFFGFARPVQQQSAGTGFILSAEGVVVTNRHVVPSGASTISVTLSDGTELSSVSVIGRTNDGDPLDVAFLKIQDKKGKTLQPVKIGDSSKVQVGDKAIAIGNALGQFQNTVTAGIISGHGRSLQASDGSSNAANSETLEDLFQTDAAINQGNSGGPLVNASGEVIGINTAIAGNAQNIGFAIPLNDIKGLISSVLQQGKLLRPYLGVRYVLLTDDYAYQYNLSAKRGAYIAPSQGQPSVVSDSPAEKAGLKEKDIITKVNDKSIDENNSLTSILGRFAVGDTISLSVVRDGKPITLKAKLEAAPTQ